MKKKAFIALGAAVLFAAGFAAIALALGSTSGAGSSGGPTTDFTYDGQKIAAADFGPPWTTDPNIATQGGWVSTPLTFSCEAGTLAMTAKADAADMTIDGNTASFAAPQGDIIVGVLWKSGNDATVTQSTWVNDGSAATVTLSKGWSGSRIFYCVQAEGSTTGTTGETTVTTGTTVTTTVTTPGTTGTTTVTTPGTTGTTTVTTPGTTETQTTTTTVTTPGTKPPKKHHNKPSAPAPKKKLAFTP